MGFDINGKNKAADGENEYFRNNVWWWRELWRCVCDHSEGILTEADKVAGEYNDCHEISKAKALRLGRHLLDQIASGAIKDDGTYGIQVPHAYPFSVENVKEFAEFCIRSGGFNIC